MNVAAYTDPSHLRGEESYVVRKEIANPAV